MSTRRRRRTHIRTLDAIKAAIVIIGILIGILVILWATTRMVQQKEPPADEAPRPAKSLWEDSTPAR